MTTSTVENAPQREPQLAQELELLQALQYGRKNAQRVRDHKYGEDQTDGAAQCDIMRGAKQEQRQSGHRDHRRLRQHHFQGLAYPLAPPRRSRARRAPCRWLARHPGA